MKAMGSEGAILYIVSGGSLGATGQQVQVSRHCFFFDGPHDWALHSAKKKLFELKLASVIIEDYIILYGGEESDVHHVEYGAGSVGEENEFHI